MSISSVLLQTFRPVSYAKKELAKAIVAAPSTTRTHIATTMKTIGNRMEINAVSGDAIKSQVRLERFAAGKPAVAGRDWQELDQKTKAKLIVQDIRNLEADIKGQLKTARAVPAGAGSINARRVADLSAALAALRDLYQPRLK